MENTWRRATARTAAGEDDLPVRLEVVLRLQVWVWHTLIHPLVTLQVPVPVHIDIFVVFKKPPSRRRQLKVHVPPFHRSRIVVEF